MSDTTCERIIASIVTRGRFGMKPGLERITPLLRALGSPHLGFPSVHLVGTNGKGSTGAFLSSILTAGGYRTGFFSSPHLVSYTERFRIDGVEIPSGSLARLASRVMDLMPDETTFFEITTAIALLWFAEERVDIAVLEAGMGGRLDATSAAPGIMTLVTPISLDHTLWLGGTEEEIAREKVGVARPGTPIISARQTPAVEEAISDSARLHGSPLSLCGRDFSGRWEGGGFLYERNGMVTGPLVPGIGGGYQAENLPVAIRAVEELAAHGFSVSPAAVARGVETAVWPGRMELFAGTPPILLDGAHNPAGARALVHELSGRRERIVLLLGIVDDKDAEGILGPLAECGESVVTVPPPVERAVDAETLAALVRGKGKDAVAFREVWGALEEARRRAGEKGLIVVCGSLYLVGAVRAILIGSDPLMVRG